MEFFLPHTPDEDRIFKIVVVSAGICEELIYRGFLMWLLEKYFAIGAAAVLQVIIFSLGHAYQGDDLRSVGRALPKTGAAGLFFTIVAIAAGSLIPGMILHALVDLSTGGVASKLFQRARFSPASHS